MGTIERDIREKMVIIVLICRDVSFFFTDLPPLLDRKPSQNQVDRTDQREPRTYVEYQDESVIVIVGVQTKTFRCAWRRAPTTVFQDERVGTRDWID